MPSTQPGAVHLTVPVPLQAKQIFSPSFGPAWGAATSLAGALETPSAEESAVFEGTVAGLPQPASSHAQKTPETIKVVGLCMVLIEGLTQLHLHTIRAYTPLRAWHRAHLVFVSLPAGMVLMQSILRIFVKGYQRGHCGAKLGRFGSR
jgi:hypothetical protein